MSHVTKQICVNYLMGFCPRGPTCLREHVKMALGEQDYCLSSLANFPLENDWVDNKMVARIEKEKQAKSA